MTFVWWKETLIGVKIDAFPSNENEVSALCVCGVIDYKECTSDEHLTVNKCFNANVYAR